MNTMPTHQHRYGDLMNPAEQAEQIPPQVIAWVGGHLLPTLAAHWPVSASQFNGNVRATVETWCRAIKGFNREQILAAVERIAKEPERNFAPRPAELTHTMNLMFYTPAASVIWSGTREFSIRGIEMCSEAKVFQRHLARLGCVEKASEAVTPAEVLKEVDLMRERLLSEGVKITGGI